VFELRFKHFFTNKRMSSTILSLIFVVLCVLQISTATYNCTQNDDCNNGTCISNKCKCDPGYIDFENKPCEYKQKEKLTVFLLSFFVGAFGVDWFYLAEGNTNYIICGVFKLLTGVSFIFGGIGLCCSGVCAASRRSTAEKLGLGLMACVSILVVVCSAANAVWIIVDVVRILLDKFKDGNGLDLKNW
jgi:hypothetical protein